MWSPGAFYGDGEWMRGPSPAMSVMEAEPGARESETSQGADEAGLYGCIQPIKLRLGCDAPTKVCPVPGVLQGFRGDR